MFKDKFDKWCQFQGLNWHFFFSLAATFSFFYDIFHLINMLATTFKVSLYIMANKFKFTGLWFFFSSRNCSRQQGMYQMKKNVLELISIFVGQTIHCKVAVWLVSICMLLYKFVSTVFQYPLTRVECATFLLWRLIWRLLILIGNQL